MLPSRLQQPAPWVALALLAWFVALVMGDGGILDVRKLHGERDRWQEEIFLLAHENDQLRKRILELRRSDRTMERVARQELGWVRDDEIVYRFLNAESTVP